MENGDEKDFVALAQEIIQKCNLNARVEKLTDCKDEFFVSLYKGLIGDNIQGLIFDPVGDDERIHNCKCVIDSLSSDVLNVDLSHINPKGIVNGDVMSIRNLLEIFSGLLEYFMECIDDDQRDFEDEFDDSNIMTANHDVISSLLLKEFGSSYNDYSRKEKDISFMEKQPSTSKTSKSPPKRSILKQDDSRIRTDPSLRLSSFTGSGHEADLSEVSDSTNELIKLGESSSSGNSTLLKRGSSRKIIPKKSTKTTLQQSTLSDNLSHHDLTQYPLSSDDGEKDFINAYDSKNQSSDHMSSSLMSSTSSWRQQISPLDAEDNSIKLDNIGLRPKTDNFTTASKDTNGDSSGRSSPILHHHYHHHFHHPADSKTPTTESVSSNRYNGRQDYRKMSGNVKMSAQVSSAALPSSNARPTLSDNHPGQLDSRHSLPKTSLLTSGVAGLPGKTIDSSSVTGISREVGNIHGQSSGITTLPDYSRAGNAVGQTTSSIPSSQEIFHRNASLPITGLSQRTPVCSIYGEHVRSMVLPDVTYSRTGHTGLSRSVNGITSSTSNKDKSGLYDQNLTKPARSTFQSSENSQTLLPGKADRSQLKATSQDGLVSITATNTTLPGQDFTTRSGLMDNSRPRTSLQTVISSGDHATCPTNQPASASHGAQLSDSFGEKLNNIHGQRSLPQEQYLLSKRASPTATTSLPTSSGLLTVSSGGYSDVFTSTNTNMNKQYIQPTSSLSARQPRESKQLTATQEYRKDMIPAADENKRQRSKVLSYGVRESAQLMGSDIDSDDSDSARYSDSAIDYNRGANQEFDSENESSEDSILRRIHDRWKRLKTSHSTKPSSQRAVKFNDDIKTIPITSRMERLRRLLDDEEQEQRQHTAAIGSIYAEQLNDIQKHRQQDKRKLKKRKLQNSPLAPKKNKAASSKQRGRLEAIYRPQGRQGRPAKRRLVKTRKRSASASPDIGRRRKNTLAEFHETLLPSLFEEFPFLHVSPQTTHSMWQKQARQISLLSKTETAALKTKSQRRVEEAEKRQQQLLKILRKELEHNERMRSERERKDQQRTIKAKVNEKRQVAARARRYYDEYQLRMRAKMLKRRTREEQILKKLFDDGLEIQKQRVRELRKYAKEKSDAIEQRQSNEIESLENYYKDQFSMLAEGMTRERQEMKVRQQAQEKVMRQMRRELRKKMEKEIEDLQENLTRDEDSAYFRQLEADRLRREFQLAMYKSDL